MPAELAVIAAQLERGDLEEADQSTAALIAGAAGGRPIVTAAALDRLPDDLLTMLCWIYRSVGGVSLLDRPFVVDDAFGADGSGLSATSARSDSVFDNPVSPGQEAASVLQARTRRPAHEEPGSRRQDTLNSQPPALMAAALDLVAPFLTRLVSRG